MRMINFLHKLIFLICVGFIIGEDEPKPTQQDTKEENPPSNYSIMTNIPTDYEDTADEFESIWAQPNDAVFSRGSEIPTLQLENTPYWIFRKRANFFGAQEICRKKGKILAEFPTEESWNEVAEIIFKMSVHDPDEKSEFLGARRYWMGLNDWAGEGDWRWIGSGKRTTFYKFTKGQPDHIKKTKTLKHAIRRDGKGPAHCGLIWNPNFENSERHTWDDSFCDGEGRYYYFICQDTTELPKII